MTSGSALGCDRIVETDPPEQAVALDLAVVRSTSQLNPLLDWPHSLSDPAVSLVYGTLFFVDARGRIRPHLVQQLSAGEEDTLLLRLREDLQWHDGTPLTVEDIRFTLEVLLHPEFTGSRVSDEFDFISGVRQYRRGEVDGIEGINMVDDQKLEIEVVDTKTLIPWSLVSLSPVASHIFEDVPVAEMKEALKSSKPVGAGPYEFVSAEEKVVELEADEGFYIEPYADEVRIEFIGEFPQEWNNKYDALFAPGTAAAGEELPDDFFMHKIPQAGFEILGLNHEHKLLQRKTIRTALKLALDTQRLADEVLGESAHALCSPLDFAPDYERDICRQEYDPERSEELLDDEGLQKYDDGWRTMEDGEPLELYLAYPTGDQIRRDTAKFVSNQLAEVGLKVNPVPVERDMFLFNIFGRKVYDMYIFGVSWFQATSYSYWQEDNPWHYGGLDKTPTVTETVEQFFGDPPEDVIAWEEAVAKDAPVVFLYSPNHLLIYSEELEGTDEWLFPAFGDIFMWNW